ncbi:MAG: hypothetical protein MK078_15335 [Crocinitomicaceae bacterium]|nr:hypothetical protein [Crocinitomicaceae bacterium]
MNLRILNNQLKIQVVFDLQLRDMNRFTPFILVFISVSCINLVNEETSQIGNLDPMCLEDSAWTKICQEHSIEKISDPDYLMGLESINNHWLSPDYVLYFDEEPKEIIGCDWYGVRIVYNKNISSNTLTGLSPQLGNDEQKRIRNRVMRELIKYQCAEGQLQMLSDMSKEVPFADSHIDYPK